MGPLDGTLRYQSRFHCGQSASSHPVAGWHSGAPTLQREGRAASISSAVYFPGTDRGPWWGMTVSIFQLVLSECNQCSISQPSAAWLAPFAFMTVLGYD